MLTAALGLGVLLVDQLTKALIIDRIGPDAPDRVIVLIPGWLRLIYVENTGAAFGTFQGNSPILTVLALVVVGVIIAYFRQSLLRSTWLSVALGLQLGGAIGNVIDRLRLGYVVDFIDFPHWPTFNMADSAITVGVVMLAIYLLREDGATHRDGMAADDGNGAVSGRSSE